MKTQDDLAMIRVRHNWITKVQLDSGVTDPDVDTIEVVGTVYHRPLGRYEYLEDYKAQCGAYLNEGIYLVDRSHADGMGLRACRSCWKEEK